MENKLESFPAEADKKEQEESDRKATLEEQKRIAIIVGEYMDFFNKSKLQIKLMDTEFGFDVKRAEKIIDKKLAPLPEKIDDLTKKKGVHLKFGNSLADVLANSARGNKMFAERRMEQGKLEYMSVITEGDKEILRNLKKNLEAVLYYIDFLCCDDEKLEMELTTRSGYLEKFENYFFEKEVPKGENRTIIKIIYPTGTSKIAYFRFFNEWKQEKIKQENLEEELEKLDDSFIDKGKIREDFKERRQPQVNLNTYLNTYLNRY